MLQIWKDVKWEHHLSDRAVPFHLLCTACNIHFRGSDYALGLLQLCSHAAFAPAKGITQASPGRMKSIAVQQKRGLRQGGSVTVRHVPGRNTAGRGQESRESRLPEKLVCNCISCGKIYHTRSDTAETALFLGKMLAAVTRRGNPNRIFTWYWWFQAQMMLA